MWFCTLVELLLFFFLFSFEVLLERVKELGDIAFEFSVNDDLWDIKSGYDFDFVVDVGAVVFGDEDPGRLVSFDGF